MRLELVEVNTIVRVRADSNSKTQIYKISTHIINELGNIYYDVKNIVNIELQIIRED